jgi:hypothetical protein
MNYAYNFKSKNKGDTLDHKHKSRLHGKDLWTVLHTSSVFLPDKPNKKELSEWTNFVKGILYFGTKFDSNWHKLTIEYIEKNPFHFDDRESSMLWLCKFHNHVNIKTEKDLFECKKEKIAKRWGNYIDIIDNSMHEKTTI